MPLLLSSVCGKALFKSLLLPTFHACMPKRSACMPTLRFGMVSGAGGNEAGGSPLECGGATPLFLGLRKVLVVHTGACSWDAAARRDADGRGSAASQSGVKAAALQRLRHVGRFGASKQFVRSRRPVAVGKALLQQAGALRPAAAEQIG